MAIVLSVLFGAAKFAAAFLIVLLCANWLRALGGVAYAALVYPLRIPSVGRYYSALVGGLVEMSFLFKFIGFVVSASGPFLPFLAIGALHHASLGDPTLLWGALLGLTAISLNIMHRVHTMELPPFREYFPMIAQHLQFDLSKLTSFDLMRMARAHFMDMGLIDLLLLIVCYGLSLYCADSLGLFGQPTHITPLQGVESGFFFLRIPLGAAQATLNPARVIISAYYGVSLFIFTAFFIGLTSRMVDEKAPSREEQIQAALSAVLQRSGRGEEARECSSD